MNYILQMVCRLRRCVASQGNLHQILGYIIFGVFGTVLLFSIHHIDYYYSNSIGYQKHQIWNMQPLYDSLSSTTKQDIWTAGRDEWNDRIASQLGFVPRYYSPKSSPMRYIYVPGGLYDVPLGQRKFLEDECLVDRCFLTTTGLNARTSDAVLIQNNKDAKSLTKHPGQIWILWLLESPLNSVELRWLQNKINWTASYRADSTIVAPYEKFVPFANATELSITPGSTRNYAQGKTKNNVVPIVMGARSLDYLHAAPPGSYIHVEDFPTPHHLATYLLKLDQDDTLYNKYFRWKQMGEFINTKFWCRLCAMLHDQTKPHLWISDVEKWWRANGTCTRNKWDASSDFFVKWPHLT